MLKKTQQKKQDLTFMGHHRAPNINWSFVKSQIIQIFKLVCHNVPKKVLLRPKLSS